MTDLTRIAEALGISTNIMLTGYWPPTNEMLRQFSTDPAKRPGEWTGANWRNHGFDIHAFFPEFPDYPGTDRLGWTPNNPGNPPFRVHYQDTLRDWERITAELRPVAIITFSLTNGSFDYNTWQIEDRALNRSNWFEFKGSGKPIPIPPDDSVPPGTARYSSLPMNQIVTAVNDLRLETSEFIAEYGGGSFLSAYISYLGLWYQSRHSTYPSNNRCLAAGHIHVGPMTLEKAISASEATLDTVVRHIRNHMKDCLSVTRISEIALGATKPLSIKQDILAGRTTGSHRSVREGLISILDTSLT